MVDRGLRGCSVPQRRRQRFGQRRRRTRGRGQSDSAQRHWHVRTLSVDSSITCPHLTLSVVSPLTASTFRTSASCTAPAATAVVTAKRARWSSGTSRLRTAKPWSASTPTTATRHPLATPVPRRPRSSASPTRATTTATNRPRLAHAAPAVFQRPAELGPAFAAE